MSDLPLEVQTVDLYIGDRFHSRMSREVFEEELEIARAVGPPLRAMFTDALAWFEGADLQAPHPLGGTPPADAHWPADEPRASDSVALAVHATLAGHAA